MSSQLYSFVKITTYVTKTESLIHHNNKKKETQVIGFLFLCISFIYSGSRTRTYDIMINSHALLPTELCRNQVHEYNINFFQITQYFFEFFTIFQKKPLAFFVIFTFSENCFISTKTHFFDKNILTNTLIFVILLFVLMIMPL